MGKVMLIFGYGYTAQALGPRLLADGWRVIGTTRQEEKANTLISNGLELIVWPGKAVNEDSKAEGRGAAGERACAAVRAALRAATHLLVSVGPGPAGDPVLQAFAQDIAQSAPHLRWVGYLSTTGVYGDHQGGWVTEQTPLQPSTDRGHERVRAEADWQALAQASGLALHIFRLAGIYGPGRGPFAKVRAGTARQIIKPGQVFSRIHVSDIATALLASIARPRPGAIYNLCDDEAAPPEDVIGFAAELLGVPLPPAQPYETAQMTPMARSFYAESKRVSNDLIKAELGVVLQYPTYREGLRALLDDE